MRRVLVLVVVAACGDKYPVAQLEDPSTCKTCHPKHYEQWSGSMHAYASDDPVFVAMNKRGSREAQLGTFCVQCHAPMAVILHPEKTDYSDFDPSALPPAERGITCYFCHDVDSVKDDHNNALVLAMDQTMRGGAKDPVDTPAHDSLFDTTLMAGASRTNRSTMCGSCHDIVTPGGVHLERTFAEWKTTIFGQDDPTTGVSCGLCHMKPSNGPIADAPGLNVTSRIDGFHDHKWPGIDQAAIPFPDTDAQLAGIHDILDPAVAIYSPRPPSNTNPPGGICLDPPGTLSVRTDTFSVGHMFPSGASQDRRAWLEVVAYAADNTVLFSSGVVPDDMDPEDTNDPVVNCVDPNPANFHCSGFWDRTFKQDGSPAHFFWDVATETSILLRPSVTTVSSDPAFDHSTTVKYDVTGSFLQIDHITATLHIRAFPYATLRELVSSGDLDPMYAAQLKTLESGGATKVWDKATKGTGASEFTNCNYEPL
jgi:Cytochrome c554 and c-prime